MNRSSIYYWKCDRPAAFHGTQSLAGTDASLESRLCDAVKARMDCESVVLSPAGSQGNHLTWTAVVDGQAMFVRLENGPEEDDYIVVESAVMEQVRALGVPVPRVLAVDASRRHVTGAWQALERIAFPDLNRWFKQGVLDDGSVAFDIGAAVARWQALTPPGFGPFDSSAPHDLRGFHASYEDYFRLRLADHLGFLVERGFIEREKCVEIERAIDEHQALLQIGRGCLVHKDLALWNILGPRDRIAAFIDFDDSISGDAMDDLSLLACFHDGVFLLRALDGYRSVRPLPDEHRKRFWLHLLRNMIVKSVIRVGAGYFDRDDGFFLIGAGGSGADLRRFTLCRLEAALRGLREGGDVSTL
ncbi:MAG: aminoglycoside phosphotransferase family protein [Verrucomicrobiaceae bacterium]|nr:aminoglycoside phosphotransferase family protein [Verrucomicrobiaceae bacterium]